MWCLPIPCCWTLVPLAGVPGQVHPPGPPLRLWVPAHTLQMGMSAPWATCWARQDDHRWGMSASLFTPTACYHGAAAEFNQHCKAMTQAGRADLLLGSLWRDLLFLPGTAEATRGPRMQRGQKKGNLKPEPFLAGQVEVKRGSTELHTLGFRSSLCCPLAV